MPDYARFECPDGYSTFLINWTDSLPKGAGISIYFECFNLNEYISELVKKGIEFDQKPTNQKFLWREARLKNVDGNQLILFYGGENRVNPPWKIKKVEFNIYFGELKKVDGVFYWYTRT